MFFTSLTLAVFLSFLADNLLLTVVVPILPEFLREKASATVNNKISSAWSSFHGQNHHYEKLQLPAIGQQLSNLTFEPSNSQIKTTEATRSESGYVDRVKSITASCLKELFHLQMLDEDSKLGLLFSTKAIVQLLSNPLVGKLTIRFGTKLPLCIGNVILFLCALAFGFADSYILLLIGRSCHGLASALIAISGMALVAELHPMDTERTVYMGRVMGAAALGVLIGYPFGGFFYAFLGKLVPFMIIASLAFLNSVLCGYQLKLFTHEVTPVDQTLVVRKNIFSDDRSTFPINLAVSSFWSLLKDKSIMIISLAIWFSTMAIAALEPTLPMWLIETIDPPKWKLGLVFVPDSVGYFIGTTFFGQVALQMGRWKTSMIAMITIGIGCLILPFCRAVWQLIFPHFAIGIGLGVVDASLMPLLACLADDRHKASYGSVYALAQTSVALAYSLGPLLGGQLVGLIGFPDFIRSVGFLNLIFSPFLLLLTEHEQCTIFRNLNAMEAQNADDAYHHNDDLSTSKTASSVVEITDPKVFGRATKKVRFHFHINNEKFPLTAMLRQDKGYCLRPPEPYERFYNDLDSD